MGFFDKIGNAVVGKLERMKVEEANEEARENAKKEAERDRDPNQNLVHLPTKSELALRINAIPDLSEEAKSYFSEYQHARFTDKKVGYDDLAELVMGAVRGWAWDQEEKGVQVQKNALTVSLINAIVTDTRLAKKAKAHALSRSWHVGGNMGGTNKID